MVCARLMTADSYAGYRAHLVEALRARGIKDLAVLRAVAETPRHLFVPEALRGRAYDDVALPIGARQTISQPYTQARYLEALHLAGTEKILEIGTGSGNQTALVAALAAQVFSVERVSALALRAQQALRDAGVRNVSVLLGDGTLGWSAYAPYDAILVAAGGPDVPPPLLAQLRAERPARDPPRRARRPNPHVDRALGNGVPPHADRGRTLRPPLGRARLRCLAALCTRSSRACSASATPASRPSWRLSPRSCRCPPSS